METARSIRLSIRRDEYAVSLDLTDAYFHVPIHRASRKFLRFAYRDTVYQFRVLPFGLNISPWAFTKAMSCVVTLFRSMSSTGTAVYLDDVLQKHMGKAKLLFNAGFKTLRSIANADPESLVEGVEYMPRKVARQIVTSAKALIQEKTEALLEEIENLITIPDTTWKKSEVSPD